MNDNAQPKPNVLVIMSDQHHWRFMGCAGHRLARTPAIDALAARGTRFDNAYCASPLCGPSRMAFMTGQLPSTIGVLDNHQSLHSDIPTFAHHLAAGGYETVLAGRMHFNGPDQRHGFERRLVGDVTPYVYGPAKRFAQEVLTDGPWHTGPSVESISRSGPGGHAYEHYDQLVAREAAEWMVSRQDDRPFALVVGFVLPHAPFVCSPADFDAFDDLVTEDDLPAWDDTLHAYNIAMRQRSGLNRQPRVTPKDQRRAVVAYLGMCASLDRQVATVLDGLARSGQADQTIVVYTSDHGEQLGEHGLWWKHSFYQGSAAVPMIFAGPGVSVGQVVSRNVSLIDVGPTLLNMVGCSPMVDVQGRSYRSLLSTDATPQTSPWPDTVFCENLWPSSPHVIARMVRRGPWKLNHYHGQSPELFNLADDPGEMCDRAKDPACQAILRELMQRVTQDWDHDALLARQRKSEQAGKLIRQAWAKSDLPEPDEPWVKKVMIRNEVDTSR